MYLPSKLTYPVSPVWSQPIHTNISYIDKKKASDLMADGWWLMAEGWWTVMMMCSGPLELTIPTHPNLLLSQPLLRTRVELVFANSKTSICQYIGWLALAPRRSHCCSMFQFLFTVTVQIQHSNLTMYSVYSFMPLTVYSSTHPPVSVPGLHIHIIYYIYLFPRQSKLHLPKGNLAL